MTAIGRRIVPAVPPLAGIDLKNPQDVEKLQESLRALQDFLEVVRDALDEGLPPPHVVTHQIDGSDGLEADIPANPTGPVPLEGTAPTVLRSDCVIEQGIVTTKGDLLGHGASQAARVPVGTNGQVLTSNSADSEGVDWQDPVGAGSSLLEGCVSSWHLDEATGLYRRDSIGREGFYDLTPTNGVTQVAGKLGNAAGFDTASLRYLSIPAASAPGLNPGVYDFAASTWFYPIGTSGNQLYTILSTFNNFTQHGYWLFQRGTAVPSLSDLISVEFGSAPGGAGCQFHTTDKVVLNSWNHLFAYFDRNAKVHVYLNGVKQTPSFGSSDNMSQFGDTTGAPTLDLSFIVGAGPIFGGPPQQYYDGRVDETQFFVFPTTVPNIPAMAAALWNNGAGRELSPLWTQRPNLQQVRAMQLSVP